ncbi:MAG: hypothetical protein HPKKFMNG_02165 [Planctomycetes bacterium]|nr:hypothetical protein [Planctomycetota bacterium]
MAAIQRGIVKGIPERAHDAAFLFVHVVELRGDITRQRQVEVVTQHTGPLRLLQHQGQEAHHFLQRVFQYVMGGVNAARQFGRGLFDQRADVPVLVMGVGLKHAGELVESVAVKLALARICKIHGSGQRQHLRKLAADSLVYGGVEVLALV